MDTFERGRLHENGLTFSCTRCNLCCRFDSGYVWLSRSDLARLAGGLRMSTREVVDRYCRVVNLGGFKHLSLREQENNDCIFWREGGCSVYGSRPLQCRSFPFWAHQLADDESWNRAAEQCPGIGIGAHHTAADVEEWLERRRVEPPLNADSLDADTVNE